MFRKFIFFVLLIYSALLLTGAEFEDFAIGVWYPWYNGEAIDVDSVGSIHSLKEIGFNSVYWIQNPTPTHYNLVSDEDMKGYFYSGSPFAQLCRSSMAYKYETHTRDRDSLEHNPTAWDTVYCDSLFSDTLTDNNYTIRIDMGRTGTILSHLKRTTHNKYWGQKAIYSGKYATKSIYFSYTDTSQRVDTVYRVDSACSEDSLCSLDKLCEGTKVYNDSTEQWIYKTQGIGVIVIPRIRVANVDTTDTTILCRITIITDKDTTSHDIMRHEFKDTDYHTDIGKFKFMFWDASTDIEDIIVEIPPDSTAPDTFWIEYIELRDAFANYILYHNKIN